MNPATSLFIRNGYFPLLISRTESGVTPTQAEVATFYANLAYYGYTLSRDVHLTLAKSIDLLKYYWADIEPVLREISGDSHQMDRFVVYKNFPKEVLDKSLTEYWIAQILMYHGFSKENFIQDENPRTSIFETRKLKVLHLASVSLISKIRENLLALPTKWTPQQKADVLFTLSVSGMPAIFSDIAFKENAIDLLILGKVHVDTFTATDLLRYAIVLSGGDINSTENVKFKSFSRPIRRQMAELLSMCHLDNVLEDIARDREKFKRLFHRLHLGEFVGKYPRFQTIIEKLYLNDVKSFSAQVNSLILEEKGLVLLASRPGEFIRRLHEMYALHGNDLKPHLSKVFSRLTNVQLLKIRNYILTINYRRFLTIAPHGNWSKLQILPNEKEKFTVAFKDFAINIIREILAVRLPTAVNIQTKSRYVKLQLDRLSALPYGRGTIFPYDENIKFIRAASYWKITRTGNIWFDCGINFFDENWKPKNTICWMSTRPHGDAAAFSGDPCNTQEMQGRACQMIDLYPEKLIARGIRYAVWNILCYSRIPFSQADDVFASFQLGENPESGKLFEPSRCQLSFPVKDESYTKYVAYVDLVERKIVYMDANLKANVSSAQSNETILSEQMPAFVEYLETLPSVHDLFEASPRADDGVPILYTDKNRSIKDKAMAFVFRPENKNNTFTQINVNELLSANDPIDIVRVR